MQYCHEMGNCMPSIWAATANTVDRKPVQPFSDNVKTDVLIIGGGMAGVLCAHRLAQKGVSCMLVEADRIGGGVTQNTTGKVTAQHGLIYADLLRRQGAACAGLYYEAQSKAIQAYRGLAERFPCDFEEKTAYVYSVDDRAKLERELRAYETLRIDGLLDERPPLPFRTAGALGMKRQAQFHPLKLLRGAAQGLNIHENTFVTDIEGKTARTTHGRIRAEHMVLATHFPLVNIPGLYFLKLYQHRSHVIALENAPQLPGLYVDEWDKGYSFRNYGSYLLVGGGDHRTGRRGGGWTDVRRLAAKAYPGATERFAWATQDCMSLDARPYIGVHRRAARSLYVATGFHKWGMTGSMVAAHVLTDLIVTGESEYADLFSPQRSMLTGQMFLNAAHAVGGLLSVGKRCPHMGCALRRNPWERSWDCACHGSRFDEAGHVVCNPAKRDIHV